MISAKLRAAAIAAALVAALALPAAAHASNDLAVSQTASAGLVSPGALVTYTVTVSNRGSEAAKAVYLQVGAVKAYEMAVDNPYQSASPSQGACPADTADATSYHSLVCQLGPLAGGASATVAVVAQVNESADQYAALLNNADDTHGDAPYGDDDNSDNRSVLRTTVSLPPTVSGSKKIKLSGLPSGCAPGDFTLGATTAVKGVKKMRATIYRGSWEKTTPGNHLRARVPVSLLVPELRGLYGEPGDFFFGLYTLEVKAKRGSAKPLIATVTFQPC
jgi:hypothetical protein